MKHEHSVYDVDTHFSINPTTRAMRNEALTKTSLIQFDHNSERFTFELPRHIEGHDMSLCNVIQVHYNNIDAQTKEQSRGVYEVDDMQLSPTDPEVVILSWLISHNATEFVGSLNFLIRFGCSNEDGKAEYVWNTAIYSGISVSSGIDNGEAVVDEYPDILQQWKEELFGVAEEAAGEAVNDLIADLESGAKKVGSAKEADEASHATAADEAGMVGGVLGDENVYRHLWFSRSNEEKARAYSDKFQCNPATGKLKAPIFEGIAEKVAMVVKDDAGGKYIPFTASAEDTNSLAINPNFYFQPSTGTLFATHFAGFADSAGTATKDALGNIISYYYASFQREWQDVSLTRSYQPGMYQIRMLIDDVWEYVLVPFVGHKSRTPFRGTSSADDWRVVTRPGGTFYAINNTGREADFDNAIGESMRPWTWIQIRPIG